MRVLARRPTARAAQALLAAVCLAALLPPSRAGAADRSPVLASPALRVGAASETTSARRIDLTTGRSLVVELPRDAKEVFVANPKVANAVVRSTRKLFIIGIEDGATSIFVMDADGQQIAALDVTVGRDLNVLRQTLRTALPNAQIEVKPAGNSVLLTGIAASAGEAQQAVVIAEAFLGQSSGGGASTSGGGVSINMGGGGSAVSGKVINALVIPGKDQVMLRVTIAEVQRQVLKDLGINLSAANWSLGGATLNAFNLGTGIPSSAGAITADYTGKGGDSTRATMRALERNGVMRLLAEPTLVAISGESAKFLAGGEIPYASGESIDPTTQRTMLTISYRPVGVSLNFTPIVLSDRRISLRVATEVSEIDRETTVRLASIEVPGIKTRRTETTVEVPSGGSIVSAGLIQQASRQVIDGFPGLKSLPVLGAMFRSRQYQRQETELMIVVTPFIAKPVNPDQVVRPTDGFVDAHDGQAVLLGRLNRLYGVAGAPPAARAYKGRFGFIAD